MTRLSPSTARRAAKCIRKSIRRLDAEARDLYRAGGAAASNAFIALEEAERLAKKRDASAHREAWGWLAEARRALDWGWDYEVPPTVA